MQLIIHRGTHEIGGNCIEVRSRQTKILLDFGLPLDFATRTPEEQEMPSSSATAMPTIMGYSLPFRIPS